MNSDHKCNLNPLCSKPMGHWGWCKTISGRKLGQVGNPNTDPCADCGHARGHHWEGGSTACALSCRCMQFEECSS